jgi:hypothetical protein
LTLNENNIKISVITESKKKLQGTKETEHYMVIYSGYNRYTAVQLGVMMWFLNLDQIKQKALTILGVYASQMARKIR